MTREEAFEKLARIFDRILESGEYEKIVADYGISGPEKELPGFIVLGSDKEGGRDGRGKD